jgi:hypothetical protein
LESYDNSLKPQHYGTRQLVRSVLVFLLELLIHFRYTVSRLLIMMRIRCRTRLLFANNKYHLVLVVTNVIYYRTATVQFEPCAPHAYFSLETHLSKQQRRSTGPGMTESIADETHQYSQLDRIRRGYVDLTYELLCRSPYGDALGSFGIQASKKVSPPASTIEPQYSLICFKARSSNPATINASQSYNHGHTQPVE